MSGIFGSWCSPFIIGDRLLAYTSVNQQWTAEQNVTQFLTYPRAGTGGTVSFVEVIVDQVSIPIQRFAYNDIEIFKKII